MALYNVHKRKTLDRLTASYHFRMREVLRRDSQEQVRDVLESLRAGRRTFSPDLRGLRDKISPVFEAHRERVIHVGVSDGIQEVTPEGKLGLWEQFPVETPVEDTLSVDLASERDKLVRGITKDTIKRNAYKVKDLTSDLLESYLENLKKTYKSVASDWFDGEADNEDVVRALQKSLKRTDNDSERIFRTETTNYFNRSRHDYFSDNTDVDYIELYAVTDGRISQICEDRHGAVVTISDASRREFMPAFHPNCRTVQRPLLSALASHAKIIEIGLRITAQKSSWAPTAWARSA